MKYFIDCEFIEGFHKPLFGKRRHFIDLISIGIVCEDGREYYAISRDYDYKKADSWVRENVIKKLYTETVHGDARNYFNETNFHRVYGQPKKAILMSILHFMGCWRDQHFWRVLGNVPEIYGYYADYDWVLFCSLFGRMIDLPKGFPMYCRDLKQMLDEKENFLNKESIKYSIVWDLKDHEDYPKQENEHNALEDARWNKRLYEFIQNL